MWIAAVGIDRYHAWDTLHNAVSDAGGALDLFLRLGFEPACPPLFDDAATGDALRRLVTDDLAVLDPEDSLVVFFAGHGHTVTRTFPGSTSVERKNGYIIPVDGDRPGGRVGTWLRLDSWLAEVTHLPVKHLLVILDACHSGIALDPVVPVIRWRGSEANLPRSLAELQARRSRRIITSSRDDELAMDSGPVPEHSLFTGCLIDALTGGLAAATGKSAVTGTELGCYVQRRVIDFPSSHQSPEFGALELDDRGEMVVPLTEVKCGPLREDMNPAPLSPAVRPDDGVSMGPGPPTVPKPRRAGVGAIRRSLRSIATVGILGGTCVNAMAIFVVPQFMSGAGDRGQPPVPHEMRGAPPPDAAGADSPAPVSVDAGESPPIRAPPTPVSPTPVAPTPVAPTPAPPTPASRAPDRREGWLKGPVFGADNVTTKMGRAWIVHAEHGYELRLERDLGFVCGVEFDRAGDPSTLVRCRASSPIWRARPDRIAMTCRIDVGKRHVRCSAYYKLQGPNRYSSDDEFVLHRDLKPDETIEAPR